MCQGVLRVQGNGFLKHLSCLNIRLFRETIMILQPSQEVVIGFHIMRVFAHEAFFFIFRQLHRQYRHYLLRYLILQCKNIFKVPVIALCPKMTPRLAIHQLCCDPNPGPSLAHTALQHITHPELLAHLLNLYRLPLVGEDGVAGNNKHA